MIALLTTLGLCAPASGAPLAVESLAPSARDEAPRGPVGDATRAPAPSPRPVASPPRIVISTARLSGGDPEAPRGAPVHAVERRTLPLARVELRLSTGGLLARGAVARGALEAVGWALARGASARGFSEEAERRGVIVSAGCDARDCRFVAEGPPAEVLAALPGLGARVRDPGIAGVDIARWRRGARAAWRTDWQSAEIVHAHAWERALTGRAGWRRADFAVSTGDARRAWGTVRARGAPLVTLVGDVELSRFLPALEAAFGGLAGDAGGAEPEPAWGPARAVLVDDPTADPAILTVAWPSPAFDDPDQPAWQLVSNALLAGYAGRVRARLREAEGLTYAVDGGYVEGPGGGRTTVTVRVPAARLGEALPALLEELERLRSAPLSEEELTAARSLAWSAQDAALDTAAEISAVIAAAVALDRPPTHLVDRLEGYRAVTVARAAACAERWLDAPRLFVVTGDLDRTLPAVQSAGLGAVTTWSWCDAVYGGACP